MMPPMKAITIIGAGAWGTALADMLARSQKSVTLYARNADLAQQIASSRENRDYLPGVSLSPAISATSDFSRALGGAGIVLFVVPAQHLREYLMKALGAGLARDIPLVLCSKGIESASGLLLSEITAGVFPQNPVAVLSGPTFAAEVARGLPCAITLALDRRHAALGAGLAQDLSGKVFRPYLSDDLIGVEIGGAVKNVIAIACGVVAGAKLGENAKAAIMTRGLAEISRLGLALGARAETFLGLSGMGDLVLTCHSMVSRNFSLGFELGQGRALPDILAARRSVTEGIATTGAVLTLAARHGVEMPVASAVRDLVELGQPVPAIVERLLARPLKQERH